MSHNIDVQLRIHSAIGNWMLKLNSYPGWKDWKRSQTRYILNFDDEFASAETFSSEFLFSPTMEREHAVVTEFMELVSTAKALREVEWYFRRYPFSRSPVSRDSHLRHCCEMYFGRFYQFRERLKNLSKAVQNMEPSHGLDFGKFIKAFDKEFDQEIKARNRVHHQAAFDEVAISRIALFDILDRSDRSEAIMREYHSLYRKTAKNWALRASRRSKILDRFLDAVAEALLKVCTFLVVAEG